MMTPEGVALFSIKVSSLGWARSEKIRLPCPIITGNTRSNTSSASPWLIRSGVSVELPQTIRSGPPVVLTLRTPAAMSAPRLSTGPQSRLSGRCVATNLRAVFRLSAIGPDCFGQ